MKSFLLLSALVLSFATVHAENWPRFRGLNGQGRSSEKNLPVEWDARKNVAWKTSIPGEGWSSPIVWDGCVFLTTVTENGSKCHVLASDARSGRILWDKELFEQVPRRKEQKNSYATPTAATDGKGVYVTFGDGSMAGLSMDGKLLWTNRDVSFYSRHGLGSSPIVHDGLVIQSFDGSTPVSKPGVYPQVSEDERTGWQIPWDKSMVVALDTTTGKRVWTGKRGMSRIAHITPFIHEVDGADQLISGAGDRMQGFNPKTGELIWSVYQQGEGVVPSPVVADSLLVTSSGFEKTTLRGIKLGGAHGDVTSTHILWEQKKGVPTQPSLIYVKPFVYAVTDSGGMVTCYKPQSGEIVWQERLGGNYSASPVYGDGKIYFTSETGETAVLVPGPEFKVISRNKLRSTAPAAGKAEDDPVGKCQASMAISDGRLFIRTEKTLFCISGPK